MRRELHVFDHEYADDMTLVSDSMDVQEKLMKTLNATCSIIHAEEPVMVVKDFEYLGSIISHDCTLDREISSSLLTLHCEQSLLQFVELKLVQHNHG